jgi:hypothetical protein
MNRTILWALTILVSAPACVISGTDDGDDDGNADESEGSDGGDSASASASNSASASVTDSDSGSASASDSASATATDSASASATDSVTDSITDSASITDSDSDTSVDESEGGDPTGADVVPQDGEWLYDEDGETTNDCGFLRQPSNGFGEYLIANTGAGEFTITPGDGTAPFECTLAGGSYDCPERLQEDLSFDQGTGADATGHVYVGVDGAFQSSTEMTGEQHGRIECDGADCALAEQFLSVTFPCEFTIPWTGTAQ